MKSVKKIVYLLLIFTFVFVSTIDAYALIDHNNTSILNDFDKLLEELHETEKYFDAQRSKDISASNAYANSSHPCHGTSDHRNCDVATYTKSCGCKVITNYCCCGKKMNTDYYLCSKHQFPYNDEKNNISLFETLSEYKF